jgi:hypothetical protein
MEGVEHRECAQAMGVPPGRLAVLLYRARMRLRRCLERITSRRRPRELPARLPRHVARAVGAARLRPRPTARERLHLWICDVCRRVRAQFGVLGETASRAPEKGPGLSPEAKARLRRALDGR